MSIFHGMSGRENNVEQTYVLLDLAGQVSLRVGILASSVFWVTNLQPSDSRLDFVRVTAIEALNHLMTTGPSTDVDPSFWGLQGKEAYDRRVYFWSLVNGICWHVNMFQSFSCSPDGFSPRA